MLPSVGFVSACLSISLYNRKIVYTKNIIMKIKYSYICNEGKTMVIKTVAVCPIYPYNNNNNNTSIIINNNKLFIISHNKKSFILLVST